jgi:transcription elongation factor Elf1
MKKIIFLLILFGGYKNVRAQVPTFTPYQDIAFTAVDINKYNFYIDSVSNVNEQTQNFTAASTNTIAAQSINIAGTTPGVHQVYAKITDINGKPSIFNIGNFIVESFYQNVPSVAANINKYNFYIDSVSNINEQAQTFTTTNNNTVAPSPVSLTGVSTGVHQLYAKVTDVSGKPSIFNIGNFYMDGDNLYQNAPPTAINIDKYSFYIDSVSTINEQPQTFTATSNNTVAPSPISLTGVVSGVHQLYAKVTALDGKPSIFSIGNFYMEGNNLYQNALPIAINIDKYSFYIDSVSNVNEQIQLFTATNNNTVAPSPVSLTGVASGVHQLYAKVTATNGKPSIFNIGNFYMEGDNLYQNAPPAAVNINRYEFYIDSVTNVNIQPLSFTTGLNNITPSTNIDLAGVIPGVHYLYARVFDVNNKPSIVNFGSFLMDQIFRYQNVPAAAPVIANMEYFLDNDPGYGLAIPITVSGASTNEILTNVVINFPSGFPAGVHYIHVRSKQNPWSIDNVVPFTTTVTVVPLTWQFVKAQLVNNTTLVSWATSQEINTSKFEIEHSEEGRNFVKVGETAAAGNSSNVSNYNFIHLKPIAGFNYYRIKQIDIDGSFKYSVIVKVLNRNDIKQTIIAPNPVVDVLNIVEPSTTFITTVEVYDSKGTLMIRKIVNADTQVCSLPVSILAKGNYMLKVNYKTKTKTFSFVK